MAITKIEDIVLYSDLSAVSEALTAYIKTKHKAVTDLIGTVPAKVGDVDTATVVAYINAMVAAANADNSAVADRVKAIEDAKGAASGYASLDENGHVPAAQLPSYVDDVIEAADLASFPEAGETGKIYVALDTNKTYRWSGSQYVVISETLAIGETDSTAYSGSKGKKNAEDIAAINDEETGILKQAQDYADGLSGNYDENGAAAGVQGDTTSTVKDVEDAVNSFTTVSAEKLQALLAKIAD